MRNVLIVLSGPSGVGKGTIAKELVKRNKDISLSISCTTRQPRNGEINGREYFFVSKEEFNNRINQNDFLEYSQHFENFYGTPKSFVLDKLKDNNVLLEIDVNGGLNVKKNFKDAVLIMLEPPTINDIVLRLKARNTETDEEISKRMERINYELSMRDKYDYVVVNDQLNVAISQIENIIKKEKLS